jgi:hypothetical protein
MTKRSKRLYITFGIYSFVVLFLTISPLAMKIWDREHPYIFGWPTAQLSVFLAACLLIIGLNTAYRIEGKINKEEKEMRERGEKLDY